jgi:aminopeptidase N
MKILFLLFFVCALPSLAQKILINEPSSPIFTIAQPFDVIHYDAEINLMKSPATDMSGICTATLTWVANKPPGNCFFFHLRDLKVDSVLFNGLKIKFDAYSEPSSMLYSYCVSAPASVKKGDTSSVTIYYSGKMTCESGGSSSWCGGTTSQSGVLYSLGVGMYANYVSTTRHWLPCYDHPSDKATFHARYKVRNGLTVAGNGMGTMTIQGDTTIYDWRHDIPCATYLYTFAVENYVPLSFGTQSLPMVVYAKPPDTASTRVSFKLLPRMVTTFEKLYGKYPFEKVGYVNTPTGAMEHETMISFPTFLSQKKDTVNSVAAHELAHQWFGDAVSPEDFRHVWLTESPATYSETAWSEELGGKQGYIAAQDAKMKDYFSKAKSEGVFSLYDFPRAKPSSNYPTTIYSKGAVVLGMLRYEVGDSLFYAALQKYIEKFKYEVATTELFEKTVEEMVGRDLAWFFNQWIYRKGWPEVDVVYSPSTSLAGTKGTRIVVKQIQASKELFTNVPVEITFLKGNTVVTSVVLNLVNQENTFFVENTGDFTSITINQGANVRALLQTTKITGVDESGAEKEQPELRIIPNPAGSDMRIAVSSNGECSALMTVINSIGEVVITGTLPMKEGENTFPFSTKELPSGTYFVTISMHYGTYSSRLLVVK